MTITDESVGVSVFKGARALAALPKSTHMLHVYSSRPTPQLSLELWCRPTTVGLHHRPSCKQIIQKIRLAFCCNQLQLNYNFVEYFLCLCRYTRKFPLLLFSIRKSSKNVLFHTFANRTCSLLINTKHSRRPKFCGRSTYIEWSVLKHARFGNQRTWLWQRQKHKFQV